MLLSSIKLPFDCLEFKQSGDLLKFSGGGLGGGKKGKKLQTRRNDPESAPRNGLLACVQSGEKERDGPRSDPERN